MEKRVHSHIKYDLYNANQKLVLEHATMAQMARYLKYKSGNTIRNYIKLGKKDLRSQSTMEMFYYKEAIGE